MKLVISGVPAVVELPGDVLTFPCRDSDGIVHTVEVTRQGQQDLIAVCMTGPPVQSGTKPRRTLKVAKVQAMATSEGRLGLKMFLTAQLALHVVMEKPAAQEMQKSIEAIQWPNVQ